MRHVLTETSSCHGNNQNLKLLSGRKIKESNKEERDRNELDMSGEENTSDKNRRRKSHF